MKILMISPHPTYSPRGTPISVLNRCRALCSLGHQVDLVTYGIGTDVEVPGLTWLRAPVPGINKVGIGPSAAKIPLDLAVFVKASLRALRGRRTYDVIHTHEEAGIVGAILSKLLRLPHVYDMGNDLSVVMANYGFSQRNPLTKVSVWVETATVRGSDSVIAHFPSIADRVATVTNGGVPATVVANVPIEAPAVAAVSAELRAQWSPDGLPIALYTGTLEKYQGVDALVDAAVLLSTRGTDCRIVIVGGTPEQQSELRTLIADRGVTDRVAVVGAVSQDRIRSCLEAADLLVSPRAFGSNTPLKIFSYMHADKPIVATWISAHTQVLDANWATLVAPTPTGLADGICEVLTNSVPAALRAHQAQELARSRFGLEKYISDVADAYVPVGGMRASAAQVAGAADQLSDELTRDAA